MLSMLLPRKFLFPPFLSEFPIPTSAVMGYIAVETARIDDDEFCRIDPEELFKNKAPCGSASGWKNLPVSSLRDSPGGCSDSPLSRPHLRYPHKF